MASENEFEALADNSAPIDATPTDFPLSLDEFCSRLSMKDKRIELIAAFHHVEKKGGRISDRSGAYTTRYDAFGSQPL